MSGPAAERVSAGGRGGLQDSSRRFSAAMAAAATGCRPGNGRTGATERAEQPLLQKRIAAMKTVDVGYAEVVRLPAQYYTPRRGKRAERRTSGGGEPAEKRNKL